jgi:hypothetical protein
MTKEDILKKNSEEMDLEIDFLHAEKSVLKSMDEYTEQECIGFELWKIENGYYHLKHITDKPTYTRGISTESFCSIKDLYQLYLQSKIKTT